jgi:hypothetical protein
LDEFLGKKREMFLLQFSLDVKRAEINKLEDIAQVRSNTVCIYISGGRAKTAG